MMCLWYLNRSLANPIFNNKNDETTGLSTYSQNLAVTEKLKILKREKSPAPAHLLTQRRINTQKWEREKVDRGSVAFRRHFCTDW